MARIFGKQKLVREEAITFQQDSLGRVEDYFMTVDSLLRAYEIDPIPQIVERRDGWLVETLLNDENRKPIHGIIDGANKGAYSKHASQHRVRSHLYTITTQIRQGTPTTPCQRLLVMVNGRGFTAMRKLWKVRSASN